MKTICVIIAFFSTLIAQEHQNLTVQNLEGEKIHLSTLVQQGPVLVNFWALWCEPCKIEMRALQTLHEKYMAKNFSIVAINQDNQKSMSKVRIFASSQEYSFHIALDPNGEAAQQFNVRNIPYSLLFDSDGTIVYKALGYKPGDEKKIEEALEKIFSEKK